MKSTYFLWHGKKKRFKRNDECLIHCFFFFFRCETYMTDILVHLIVVVGYKWVCFRTTLRVSLALFIFFFCDSVEQKMLNHNSGTHCNVATKKRTCFKKTTTAQTPFSMGAPNTIKKNTISFIFRVATKECPKTCFFWKAMHAFYVHPLL